MHDKDQAFATKAVHAGTEPEPITGAIMTPVFMTSTYVQKAPAEHTGYEYSRTGNPTRRALAKALAALENADHGLCFASGMSATDTVLRTLKSGDHVIAGNDLYGGTYRLFTKVYQRFGLTFSFVDCTDLEALENAFQDNTKLLWLESPTNPLLRITDIKAAAALAKKRDVLLAVDNTFATPALQQPLDLGADIVVHSTTKYLGGHSDVVGGAVLTRSQKIFDELAYLQNAVGAVPGPMDCFLVLRGLKTLSLRMERHCANAKRVATFLAEHPKVDRVYYPGLESHPNHEIAAKQMNDFGGMVSFELKGTVEQGKVFCTKTKLFQLAESLGGVESLIEHPPTMTHGAIEPEVRRAAGLADGLIRLSVGVEDCDDLIADLTAAFEACFA
ncbi:MAG: cystathionine gamma-synthase [Planctomycetota bacterium]|nr:cystathionine gamma-synthase [Planctomycetota bacterium]